jgi:hypothetical protein
MFIEGESEEDLFEELRQDLERLRHQLSIDISVERDEEVIL